MKRSEAVDRIGEIDNEIERLMNERQRLVTKFQDREGAVTSNAFKLSGFYRDNTWLDPKKLKRKFGVAEVAKCYSHSTSFCVRISPLKT